MKSAFGVGRRHQLGVHLIGREDTTPVVRPPLPRPSTPTHRCRRHRRRRRPARGSVKSRTVGAVARDARRLVDDVVRQLVAGGRRHVNGDAEHARRVRERRRDVVAVADERDRAAAAVAPSLAQRQHVGERLARMLLVGQRVDDVQVAARRRPASRPSPARTCESPGRGPIARGCARCPRAARACLRRTAAGRCSVSPPSSRTAISNVDRVRSDGFSNSSATCRPASAVAVGAWRPSRRSAFICAETRSSRSRSSGDRSRIDRKSLATSAHRRRRDARSIVTSDTRR